MKLLKKSIVSRKIKVRNNFSVFNTPSVFNNEIYKNTTQTIETLTFRFRKNIIVSTEEFIVSFGGKFKQVVNRGIVTFGFARAMATLINKSL